MESFCEQVDCFVILNSQLIKKTTTVPKEVNLDIYINGKEIVSILCTPNKIEYLVKGFLFSERFIKSKNDIKSFEFNEKERKVNIELFNKELKYSLKRTITSGFGKGTMFGDRYTDVKLETDTTLKVSDVYRLASELNEKMNIYQISGGVHASALAQRYGIIIVAEDIGRHNTFDKIVGECLEKNINTKDKIILTTGRISTEMLLKATRMKIPVIISMKSPTSNSVKLAKELGVTLIGYAKCIDFKIYSNVDRVIIN